MELDEYNSKIKKLQDELVKVMNQLDQLDPESPQYDSLSAKQIEIQNALIALDNQYNAERKKA